MALTASWTPFANLVSLLTLRNSLNVFNEAVETDLHTLGVDVATLYEDKIEAKTTGLVHLVCSAPIDSVLNTAYQKVAMVNTLAINKANGHITVDIVNNTYTVNTAGVYKFYFNGSVAIDNGETVTFNYNKNGTTMMEYPPEFTGDGTKRLSIGSLCVMELEKGDVIYIEAKSDASSTTISPASCCFMIEKTYY